MPPWRTSSSTAAPSAGLAVIPRIAVPTRRIGEPTMRCSALTGSRCTSLAHGSISEIRAMPSLTHCRVPPMSWMLMAASRLPSWRRFAVMSAPRPLASQPRPTRSTPGDVWMGRIAGDGSPEHVESFAVRVHTAPRSVRKRDDAVDVGKRFEAPSVAPVVGDRLRYRGRAVDRRNHRQVVAGWRLDRRSGRCLETSPVQTPPIGGSVRLAGIA